MRKCKHPTPHGLMRVPAEVFDIEQSPKWHKFIVTIRYCSHCGQLIDIYKLNALKEAEEE